MGQHAPSPGQVTPEGEPAGNGESRSLIDRFRLEPTRTTRLMQLVVGTYLLVAGLLTTLLSYVAVPSIRHATEKSIRAQRPDLSANEVKAIVDFGMTVGLALAVLIGLILVAFGVMTFLRRWSWLFYADLVICGLTGLGVISGLVSLTRRGNADPLGLALPNLVLSAAALAIFIWMLVTRLQGSIWGTRKVSVP
jgi:hypothetical protein